MMIYAVAGEQDPFFPQKRAYPPGGMSGKQNHFKCQPAEVYHIAVIDRLERWHFQVLFPAKLPEHRKFCMRGGNFSIGRIQIAIAVEVYISENVVTVSVGVYHHERQAG